MKYYVNTYYRDGNDVLYIESVDYTVSENCYSWTGLHVTCRYCSERLRKDDLDSAFLYDRYVPEGNSFLYHKSITDDEQPYLAHDIGFTAVTWMNEPCLDCMSLSYIDTALYRFSRHLPSLPQEYEQQVFYPHCEIRREMGDRVSSHLFVDCPFHINKNTKYYYRIEDKEIADQYSNASVKMFCKKTGMEFVTFDLPRYYLLPSQFQAYLSLCRPDGKIFGASVCVDETVIFSGRYNETAWYQSVKDMTVQGYYKASIIDDVCDFMIDEDGTLGIVQYQESHTDPQFYIAGIPEKIKAFCELIHIPYESVQE